MKQQTSFDSPSKVDTRTRRQGLPTSLRKSPKTPIVDCMIQSLFHIPTFVEPILRYDDSLINDNGVLVQLQRLLIQLIYCKRKETSAEELYNVMMEDYNTRFRNVNEFLIKLIERIDEPIAKYQSLLNIDQEGFQFETIKGMFISKITDESQQSQDYYVIKLDNVENLLEALQKQYKNMYFTKVAPIMTFELTQCQSIQLKQILYLDEFMIENQDKLEEHHQMVQKLKTKRETILNSIKNLENYNNSNIAVPQMLQQTIEIIQSQRAELLQGDPAVEGLLGLIIEANQELDQLRGGLEEVQQEIKTLMVGFNKQKYHLHSIIIVEGDYECCYIKNRDSWYFYEDSHVEIKKEFEIENQINPTSLIYLQYISDSIPQNYSLHGEKNLLENLSKKPYSELVRKDLQHYASQFNNQIEQEFQLLRQQQSAEEVVQVFLSRFNYIAKIVNGYNKRRMSQIPILTNFATFLISNRKQVDDLVKWQILDCSIRDMTGQSIQDIKNMGGFAQKLMLLLKNQPQRTPTQLSVTKKDMQIMQMYLQDYVEQVRSARILIYSIQCIFEDKAVQGLNALRVIHEQNHNNSLFILSQDILKAFMIRLCFDFFNFYKQQEFMKLWENIQYVITYFVYVQQTDCVFKQIVKMVKEISKKSSKKALNSDQQKIIKRFISCYEDKKQFDSGLNLLMKRDEQLEQMIEIDWNNDQYHWMMENKDDLASELGNQVDFIQQHYKKEFGLMRELMQQPQTIDYDDRVNHQFHSAI